MHRPFEALTAMLVRQPLASASCGMLTIVIATTPTNPSAAIMATIAIGIWRSIRVT